MHACTCEHRKPNAGANAPVRKMHIVRACALLQDPFSGYEGRAWRANRRAGASKHSLAKHKHAVCESQEALCFECDLLGEAPTS
eukprot:4647528-Pleurochrysis_carterae.AAC.3